MVSLTNGAQIPENSILFSVTAAIDNTRTSRPLQLIQYDDTLPVVAVSLTQNSKPWIPPSGATIQVRVGKPDGHFVIADALGVDENGIVYFAVILQMTTAYGLASATLEFTDSGVKNCAPITLEITPNPVSNESIESTDDYKSLVQILQQVQSLASSAEQSQQQAAASEAAAAQSAAEAKAAAESIGIDDSTVSATKLWSSEKSVASFAPLASALKVSGTGDGLVNLTPTVPWYFQGLRLFGKTTQDGTPSPENPVPLVSAGTSGQVNVQLIGRSLIPISNWASNTTTVSDFKRTETGLTFTIAMDSDYAGVYGSAIFTPPYKVQFAAEIKVGSVVFDTLKISIMGTTKLVEASQFSENKFTKIHFDNILPTGRVTTIYFQGVPIGTSVEIQNLMVSADTGDSTYQPYEGKALTYATPNGLPGIPVTSGGNYTDETGQQWICDEVDFEAGTYTQNIGKVTLNGTDYAVSDNSVLLGTNRRYQCRLSYDTKENLASGQMSNYAPFRLHYTLDTTHFYIQNNTVFLFFPDASFPNAESVNKQLQQENFVALYSFAVPVVSEITAETLAAYAAMQSYAGTTNILAEGCGIEATAIADAQTVIAGITDRLSALEQNAIGG